jgi:hypothetical protein
MQTSCSRAALDHVACYGLIFSTTLFLFWDMKEQNVSFQQIAGQEEGIWGVEGVVSFKPVHRLHGTALPQYKVQQLYSRRSA